MVTRSMAGTAEPFVSLAERVRGARRSAPQCKREALGPSPLLSSLPYEHPPQLRAMETKTPERFKAPAAAPGPKTARPSTAATPRALSPLTTAPRAPSTPH